MFFVWLHYSFEEIIQWFSSSGSIPLQAEDTQFSRDLRSVQFAAMGQNFKLDMQPNTKLLAPYVSPVAIKGVNQILRNNA